MKSFFIILKLSITASLCYWLFSRFDLDTLSINFSQLGIVPIVAGIVIHSFVFAFFAFRWWLLLSYLNPKIPFYRTMPSYYLGLFFNNFLPTTLGGDAIRVLHLRSRGVNTKALISSAILDRAIGLISVILMGFTALILFDTFALTSVVKGMIVAIFVLGLVTLLMLFSDRCSDFIETLADKYRQTRIRAWFIDILIACYSYRNAMPRLVTALSISVIGQSLVVSIYYFLGQGLGLNLSISNYFIAIPAVFIAASLPVSIGGLGVREGALVAMLVSSGANMSIAINLSLFYLLVFWASSLPGALVPLLTRSGKIPANE